MKAVRLIKPGQPLEMQEIPIPQFGSRDVLVRVKAAGICHSDAHYRAGVSPVYPLPLTLGHEISGRVISAGSDAADWRDKTVIIPAVIPCGTCDLCDRGHGTICRQQKSPGIDMHGGFASHITVPSIGLCEIDLARLELVDLELAYAISCHKSQGSEFPIVVMPIMKQHFLLLQRNLLYTAITRGRKKVFVVGDPAAWGMAVRNTEQQERYTALPEQLQYA